MSPKKTTPRLGRPPLPGGAVPLRVTISEKDREKLDRMRAKAGAKSDSEIIREIIAASPVDISKGA